MVEKIFQM